MNIICLLYDQICCIWRDYSCFVILLDHLFISVLVIFICLVHWQTDTILQEEVHILGGPHTWKYNNFRFIKWFLFSTPKLRVSFIIPSSNPRSFITFLYRLSSLYSKNKIGQWIQVKLAWFTSKYYVRLKKRKGIKVVAYLIFAKEISSRFYFTAKTQRLAW